MKEYKLYLLTTAGLGDYYIVAKDPTSAESSLSKLLYSQDYGSSISRVVNNIKLLAKGVDRGFVNLGTQRLILPEMGQKKNTKTVKIIDQDGNELDREDINFGDVEIKADGKGTVTILKKKEA
jgi:hypothetical protein